MSKRKLTNGIHVGDSDLAFNSRKKFVQNKIKN